MTPITLERPNAAVQLSAVCGRFVALEHPVIADHARDSQALIGEDHRPPVRLRPAMKLEFSPHLHRLFVAEKR